MRIGVVGVHYGHIGGMFQSALKAEDGEVVGIVEADDSLYDEYNKDRKIPRYKSLDELLEEGRPELILEGIAHGEKAALVAACGRAGVHVLLDKPLCRNLEDWERIRKATEDIRISMWFTSRSYPPFLALRDAILEGVLGEIVSLISTHPHKLGPWRPDWYFDPGAYTGTFHDLACHGVDQVRWLTGAEYIGVHALETCKKHLEPRLVDHIQASFELSNGAMALLTADWLTPQDSRSFGDSRVIVMGTRGSAHLRAYAGDHLLIVTDDRGTYEPKMPVSRDDLFVQDMIEAISREEENFISTGDVLAVSKACLIAQESARQGGTFLKIE